MLGTHVGEERNFSNILRCIVEQMTSGRNIIQGMAFATILCASFVFPVLSEDIPKKFFWPMSITQKRKRNAGRVISKPCPNLTFIMPDVEMKPADTKTKDEKKGEEKKEESKVPPSPVIEIKSNVALIDRAVFTLEPRFTHRVLRTLTALRKRIDNGVLRDAIEELYPKGMRTI